MKTPPRPLRIHNASLESLLPGLAAFDGTSQDLAPVLRAISARLEPALKIKLTPKGFLMAAERPGSDVGADPTNYHAVWVRDTVWGYLGLLATPGAAGDADRCLMALLDYMSCNAQLERMTRLISDPRLRLGREGAMNVPHIRFDATYFEREGVFRDVQAGGKDQFWNHKQNDALGLFLKAALDALLEGRLAPSRLKPAHWRALALLPAYLEAVDYAEMEDAGAWEEIERVNSSSVGIVTAALESFDRACVDPACGPELALSAKQSAVGSANALVGEASRRTALIDRGYTRLKRQLARGESPDYPATNPRRRTSDAALLSLIYPARPRRLQPAELAAIFNHVEPLVGEVGVKRYLGDTYQCAGYWSRAAFSGDTGAGTDDFSAEADFVARQKGFRPGSEAQWFFDSWISICAARLFAETAEPRYRALQLAFLERSLAQVTGESPAPSADGTSVPAWACPESYNMMPDGKTFAPSPITPLNWAKASLRIALEAAR